MSEQNEPIKNESGNPEGAKRRRRRRKPKNPQGAAQPQASQAQQTQTTGQPDSDQENRQQRRRRERPQEPREQRESRGGRDGRDGRDRRDNRDARDNRRSRSMQDTRRNTKPAEPPKDEPPFVPKKEFTAAGSYIESRCGRICSECGFFERCGGCTNIPKPPWANRCPIKSCCEEKELMHCGKCEGFPCRKLVSFAKDKDYGDGGIRLDQCRAWKEEDREQDEQNAALAALEASATENSSLPEAADASPASESIAEMPPASADTAEAQSIHVSEQPLDTAEVPSVTPDATDAQEVETNAFAASPDTANIMAAEQTAMPESELASTTEQETPAPKKPQIHV